eukprot:12023499-Alexandrium_andersonii.AAC.1
MSASLVGSEMCIRDSVIAPSVGASPRSAWLLPHQAPSTDLSPHRPAAVSYTHLTLPTICSV